MQDEWSLRSERMKNRATNFAYFARQSHAEGSTKGWWKCYGAHRGGSSRGAANQSLRRQYVKVLSNSRRRGMPVDAERVLGIALERFCVLHLIPRLILPA